MIRKIHIKLILIFICVFLLANAGSYMFASINAEKDLLGQLTNLMSNVAQDAKEVYEKGAVSVEDIEKLHSSTLITVNFFINDDDLAEVYGVSRDTLKKVADAPIIIEARRTSSKGIRLPMCIVRAGSYFIVTVPGGKSIFHDIRDLIMQVNISSLLFGSLLMLAASRFIVKSVRKLSEATEKIAKGDFSIHIQKKSNDEIGQLIDNFNTMTTELAGMEMMRNDFVSSISHEFKTPLMSIEGYVKLLRDCKDETERNEYIDIITAETKRLAALSSNILLLNRIENENIAPAKTYFRLDEQIRQVILFHENKWSIKEIDLQPDLDEITYEGNEQLMYQVWLNLLDNAVKFSNHGGTIELNLRKTTGKVIFTITDYGQGMSEDVRKRMFEKFFSGDKSRTKEGNGLGLSIVKRIIDMHGGTIGVTSTPPDFTTIKVHLPQGDSPSL